MQKTYFYHAFSVGAMGTVHISGFLVLSEPLNFPTIRDLIAKEMCLPAKDIVIDTFNPIV
jgi:hypothetical protein